MRRGPLLLLSSSCLLLALAGPAASQRGTPSNAELTRLQAEYRDETARARRLRAEAAAAAEEIVDLDRQLRELRRAEAEDDVQLEAQRARLKELADREAALLAALSRERAAQGRLLSALQMMSRKPPPPLLIPADQAVDTVRASILIRAITPDLQERAKTLVERQAEIARIRRLAALSSERLFTVESAQNDRRAEIEGLTARKTALRSVLRAEAARAERATKALEARIRELGGQTPQIADAPEEAPAARLPAGRSRLTPPIAGTPSQRFGGRSAGWSWRSSHEAVGAPAAGRVAYAGPLKEWGEVVILDLGPGWRAVIAGLDRLEVETGQRVADGQTLGRTGEDGEAYFELRRQERPIDPAPWLR